MKTIHTLALLAIMPILLAACSEETQQNLEENLTNGITNAIRDTFNNGMEQLKKELHDSGMSEAIKKFLDDDSPPEKQKIDKLPNLI